MNRRSQVGIFIRGKVFAMLLRQLQEMLRPSICCVVEAITRDVYANPSFMKGLVLKTTSNYSLRPNLIVVDFSRSFMR